MTPEQHPYFRAEAKVAALIKKYEYPMVLNVVLHRLNIEHIQEILEMAGPCRRSTSSSPNPVLRLGVAQRERLLPSREQLLRAEETTNRFRERVGKKMRVLSLSRLLRAASQTLHERLGSVFLTVTPDGTALPCHAAKTLPGLTFPNVKDASIEWIWRDSPGFNHYRGDSWMKEPCAAARRKRRTSAAAAARLPSDRRRRQRRPGLRSFAAPSPGDADGGEGQRPGTPHRWSSGRCLRDRKNSEALSR